MADDPREMLRALCADHSLERFTVDEMAALLEDGEEVGWIVEQVLGGAEIEPAPRLSELLTAIQLEVAPPDVSGDEPGKAAAAAGGEPVDQSLVEALAAGDVDLDGFELPPGVDASQLREVMAGPRGALLADFGAYCDELGFSQDKGGTPEAEDTLRQLHDEWLETPRPSLDNKRPSEVLEGGRLFPEKVETYRREAPKIGRNDPCPCGSGRKHKKCCGKGG